MRKETDLVELQRLTLPEPPRRPPDGHKGTFGRVLLIGGSVGMAGSVALAARAALRSGSGLVTAAVPHVIQPVVAGFDPCVMTLALPCRPDGQLQSQSLVEIARLIEGYDAIGIGPGLGQTDAAATLVRSVLARTKCPVVMDADALNLAATHRMLEDSKRTDFSLTLTPHPGEFSRLTELSTDAIAATREASSVEFARRYGVTLVLKGAGTVVTDGERLYVNSTGNAGMGTGGSGDVLTGVITSLAGQKMSSVDAAALGVHVHGVAGDCTAASKSERAMTAADIVEHLGAAWQRLARD
jgi:ADP-dependent NAD(P)H-hydrate dehydratase